MTQRDRDRLVALKKAKKGLITQRQAAEEIGQTERHVRRLLKRLKGKGDGALVHALRGRQSNRKLDEKTKQKALEILGRAVCRNFGPTLAAEYLASQHDIHAGRETVRSWMVEGKLWRASRQRIDQATLATSRLRFLFVAAKIWRHAGRTGVSYSDHYEEKGVFERLMDRLRRIAPGAQGYAPLMVPALR